MFATNHQGAEDRSKQPPLKAFQATTPLADLAFNKSVHRFVGQLKDGDSPVEAVQILLATSPGAEVIPYALQSLGDKNTPQVRSAVVETIGKRLDEKGFTDIILQCLQTHGECKKTVVACFEAVSYATVNAIDMGKTEFTAGLAADVLKRALLSSNLNDAGEVALLVIKSLQGDKAKQAMRCVAARVWTPDFTQEFNAYPQNIEFTTELFKQMASTDANWLEERLVKFADRRFPGSRSQYARIMFDKVDPGIGEGIVIGFAGAVGAAIGGGIGDAIAGVKTGLVGVGVGMLFGMACSFLGVGYSEIGYRRDDQVAKLSGSALKALATMKLSARSLKVMEAITTNTSEWGWRRELAAEVILKNPQWKPGRATRVLIRTLDSSTDPDKLWIPLTKLKFLTHPSFAPSVARHTTNVSGDVRNAASAWLDQLRRLVSGAGS